MLESLVTWVLNNYVGEYLEDLNADQLSIAFLQGQVELENVPLKTSALRKFDIPLKVKHGIIGKLTLSIPITQVRSAPWILKMSDLLVLLGPTDGEFDARDVEVYEHTKKEQLLDALEVLHKSQILGNLGLSPQDEATRNQYWGASLVSAISNNIQLILTNVHIRYEDDITMPDRVPFNFGIRIQQISIQTTNSHWKSEFVQPSEGVNVFKKLDIKGLSVFWNCNQPLQMPTTSHAEFKLLMSPETTKGNQFILQPFSMEARMEKNSSKYPLKSLPAVPRFKFDLRPQQINIELSKKQLAQIRLLTREWARFDRARQHRKWRPLVSVKNNASKWWKFAYGRVREEAHRSKFRCTKDFLLTRAKHFNQYCKAYRRKLEAFIADEQTKAEAKRTGTAYLPAPATAASVEDTAFMKQIEHDSNYSYHELHLFRETVFRRLVSSNNASDAVSSNDEDEVAVEHPFDTLTTEDAIAAKSEPLPPNPTGGSGLYGWFSGWFSSAQNNEEKPESEDVNQGSLLQMWPKMQQKELPTNLKKVEEAIEEELLDVLNESWDDSTVLRRDTLLAEIVLFLERMVVRFVDDDVLQGSRVIAMDMKQVATRLLLSPREHRTEISLSVGDMSVQRLKVFVATSAEEDAANYRSGTTTTASGRTTPMSSRSHATTAGGVGSVGSIVDDEDEQLNPESLVLPVGVTPQLLFAVGKAGDEELDEEQSNASRQKNTFSKDQASKPLFQMMYRRMAPRLKVLHELDAKFSAISVVYDEDALNGLSNLFDTESAIFENASDDADIDFAVLESVGETHCFLNFAIPSVQFQLRSRRTSLASNAFRSESSTFAAVRVTEVDIGISKTEQYSTRVKIGLDSLVVDDLYEKQPQQQPLIKTLTHVARGSESLSASCPDISAEREHDARQERAAQLSSLSSSLPSHLDFDKVFRDVTSQTPQLHSLYRKSSKFSFARKAQVVDNDFGRTSRDKQQLSFIFVDDRHPEFESRFEKRHCIAEGDFGGVELVFNRRSWTMLLDFFGALGVKKSATMAATAAAERQKKAQDLKGFDEKYLELLYGRGNMPASLANIAAGAPTVLKPLAPPKIQSRPEDYVIHVKLSMGSMRIHMAYPTNQTRLGMVLLNSSEISVKVNVKNIDEPMHINVVASEVYIHDSVPFYSRLYTERLALKPSKKTPASTSGTTTNSNSAGHRKIEISVMKHRTDDPNLKRDCDMKMQIKTGEDLHLHYVHTHRFFCAIMDFWMQFADLQDQVRRMNELDAMPEEQQKTRSFIDVILGGGVSLVLPLNQFSDQVILFETSNVAVSNHFQLASQTPEFDEYCIENKDITDRTYDCLVEKMTIHCSQVSIHSGYRLSVDDQAAPPPDYLPQYHSQTVGQGAFQSYYFAVEPEGVLTRKMNLGIVAYRNLSGLISHNIPELALVTHFEDVDILFTTDFYCLLRGFLEKNLGDPLIPVPETMPIEILQNPEKGIAIAGVKFPTFTLRWLFTNVQFHFLVPTNPGQPIVGKNDSFGRMVLYKARIAFDSYIDSISEFDLICESTELIDTRFDDYDDGGKESVFPVILCAREGGPGFEASKPGIRLMSEAHIMMKKDEAPTVTLVLQHARVLLILDWLNNAKDFFLLNTTFVPPEEPGTTADLSANISGGKDIVIEIPGIKGGIEKTVVHALHTVTLKITLRDSDLIFLEQPNDHASLAMVCFTTAVVQLDDKHGVLEGTIEVQRLSSAWCIMSSEQDTKCQVSNDFTATLSITRDLLLSVTERARELVAHPNRGKTELPKQKFEFGVEEFVARLSYRDMLVLQSVIQGSLQRLQSSFEKSLIPKRQDPGGRPPFVFSTGFFNFDNACFWFLEDSQGVALPMLRLILSKIRAEYTPSTRLKLTSLQVGVDYFNQRVFGWEPFIEPWAIRECLVEWLEGGVVNGVLATEPESTLNINVTHALVLQTRQFQSKWIKIKHEGNFRSLCARSRADHLPYLLKNETGCPLLFTTDVDEVNNARAEKRKQTAKWFHTADGKKTTFEFQVKRLISIEKATEPRQLIVRVDGWDEISPVDVDSVGTYFRITKMANMQSKTDVPHARVVVAVTMDADGRKVVTVRSALLMINDLTDPVQIRFRDRLRNAEYEHLLPSEQRFSVPLNFVNSDIDFVPLPGGSPKLLSTDFRINWGAAKVSGDIVNQVAKFRPSDNGHLYCACVSIKREHYPEYERLSGHTIVFCAPMTVMNLLPVEIEFTVNEIQRYRILANDRLQITTTDLENNILVGVHSEAFSMSRSVSINRSQFLERSSTSTTADDRRIPLTMNDRFGRIIDLYASVYVSRGGALKLSLWVPYWIVNRSGIPLIIKQEATNFEAAGQFDDHERAKDRNPLMFSFANPDCPQQVVVRVGNKFERDQDYVPHFCNKFELSAGVQALKLLLTHDQQNTLMYNVGVEVRQGTGRYKDTQIVLFTPRYRLYNQSSTKLFICHQDELSKQSKHVRLDSKCNLIWHENFEGKRHLCVRREDVPHWSFPFRLDKIGSFHVTMRSRDETPHFVRVEVALSGASFWVTFTDANYFPAPIRIENRSDVPVLYQQASSKDDNLFRTICKARSVVDYSWDNIYAEKLLTLQVYENKSNTYDPAKPRRDLPRLTYDNYIYVQYRPSFDRSTASLTSSSLGGSGETADRELVLEALPQGKVILNTMNVADSSQRQLWKLAKDGAIENVGLTHTAKEGQRMVLDALDYNNFVLMVVPQSQSRFITQTWTFTKDARLSCEFRHMFVTNAGKNRVILAKPPTEQSAVDTQQFGFRHQKPGSGVLEVECLHVGPTLVVRITDPGLQASAPSTSLRDPVSPLCGSGSRWSPIRSRSTSPVVTPPRRRYTSSLTSITDDKSLSKPQLNFDVEIRMPSGIGISIVNSSCEEIVYIRFQGVHINCSRFGKTYQATGYVNYIQADNQLLSADRWPVLFCQGGVLGLTEGATLPNSATDPSLSVLSAAGLESMQHGSASSSNLSELVAIPIPALKLEMNCTPMQHYDAFDCFRVKLCDTSVLLDETHLWKVVQFIQETETANVVSQNTLLLPPNIEPDMNAPGTSTTDGMPTRRCYFGTLDLEIGTLSLTVVTVPKNGLPKELQRLKKQFNIKLVSFENALVTLPPFRQLHYFETLKFLIESLSKFYMMELQKQTLNIVFTMDAFGNPRGFATDMKDSFQGLLFEADLPRFIYSLGYGVTNSLSKVASSMSHGVGSLTFDEQHELMRQRLLRVQPQDSSNAAAFSHLCNGVKCFGVGLFGGATALVGNTVRATKKEGILTGLTKGVVTGAVDTFTKPVQGVFDLLGGTASAIKEGFGNQTSRRSRFPDRRVRLPRVCTNLQSHLAPYRTDLAEAQQELLRINGYATNELLLDVEVILKFTSRDSQIVQRVLICSEQCYCLRQIDDNPASVTQRVAYRYFKNIQIDKRTHVGEGRICVAVVYDTQQRTMSAPRLVCDNTDIARRLCEKVLRAKQLYDHSKRTLTVAEDFEFDQF